MRTPSSEEIKIALEKIRKYQSNDRPRGMHPQIGLLYQPIPFKEFSGLAHERNSSQDRLRLLSSAIDYSGKNILDLGCANGFFLFSLLQKNERFTSGLGIDHFQGNVEIGRMLSELYDLNDHLTFQHGELNPGFLEELFNLSEWEICHLLSVHHHLIRDIGIEKTKRIFQVLFENVNTVAIEQGMLTDEEFSDWTGGDNRFASGSFARMFEMLQTCGIPRENCFPIGIGMYLSGDRDDNEGWKRVMVGFSQSPKTNSVNEVTERHHRNGIVMELIETGVPGDGEVWKHAVSGGSHAERELRALTKLSEHEGFPRVLSSEETSVDASRGLIRLQRLDIRKVNRHDIERMGALLREQALSRLMSLASEGIIHNEINTIHLLLSDSDTLVLIDFETSLFLDEDRKVWMESVWEPNPALGIGGYDRAIHETEEWKNADLISLNNIFNEWGLSPITPEERAEYFSILKK